LFNFYTPSYTCLGTLNIGGSKDTNVIFLLETSWKNLLHLGF